MQLSLQCSVLVTLFSNNGLRKFWAFKDQERNSVEIFMHNTVVDMYSCPILWCCLVSLGSLWLRCFRSWLISFCHLLFLCLKLPLKLNLLYLCQNISYSNPYIFRCLHLQNGYFWYYRNSQTLNLLYVYYTSSNNTNVVLFGNLL